MLKTAFSFYNYYWLYLREHLAFLSTNCNQINCEHWLWYYCLAMITKVQNSKIIMRPILLSFKGHLVIIFIAIGATFLFWIKKSSLDLKMSFFTLCIYFLKNTSYIVTINIWLEVCVGQSKMSLINYIATRSIIKSMLVNSKRLFNHN